LMKSKRKTVNYFVKNNPEQPQKTKDFYLTLLEATFFYAGSFFE